MEGKLKYWIWLSSLVKIAPFKRYELLRCCKDPEAIWQMPEEELKKLSFLAPQAICQLMDARLRKDAARHLEALDKNRIDVITINDEYYPKYLKNIYDPPVVIYTRGKLVKDERCVAVVGSRKATYYGLSMAEKLSSELARHGITVVSGMARGIDSKAHKGALSAGGRTIAVLGCGLDIAYPYENGELMKDIENCGTVISEYLPGTPPAPFNFPARNRIISGISLGVAVIEANEKSGSLITANYALEQGREVFAVPGNINSMNSTGTNRLLREGAGIVTSVSDILEGLNIEIDMTNIFNMRKCLPEGEMNKDEVSVAKRLALGPVHIDTVARDCGISIQLAGSILLMLELNGFVEQLPGKFYRLIELV